MPKMTAAAFLAGSVTTAAVAMLFGAGHAEHTSTTAAASVTNTGSTTTIAQPGQSPDRTSYAIGYDLGVATLDRLAYDRVNCNKSDMLRGFADAINKAQPEFTEMEMRAALAVLERKVAHTIATDRIATDPVFKALALDNLAKSESFITKFTARDDTQSLTGDIYYRVIESGEGDSPRASDTVTVDFQARLIDGTLIGAESGYTTRVDGMLSGVQILMQSMKPGDRWIAVIPPQQAFGIGGRFPDIGPNQAIVAEVTLRKVGR
jgi:FKBP-type peptidyl-prolyl cis-trans isomerase FklB